MPGGGGIGGAAQLALFYQPLVNGGGTADGTKIATVTGGPTTYNVTVSGATGNGTITHIWLTTHTSNWRRLLLRFGVLGDVRHRAGPLHLLVASEDMVAELTKCIRTDLDCADICHTAANFMLRGSDLHAHTCAACAAAISESGSVRRYARE